jgi:hypothetical protein
LPKLEPAEERKNWQNKRSMLAARLEYGQHHQVAAREKPSAGLFPGCGGLLQEAQVPGPRHGP